MQTLFGAFAFGSDLVPFRAAARDSLASFLRLEGERVPRPHRRQLWQYADSPTAPKTVGQWRQFYAHIFLACWRPAH